MLEFRGIVKRAREEDSPVYLTTWYLDYDEARFAALEVGQEMFGAIDIVVECREARKKDQKMKCDICEKKAVYDANPTLRGVWVYLCKDCFTRYGIKLGLGYGQRLDQKNEDGVKC